MEDASINAAAPAIDLEKAALLRKVIRDGLTYENMTPEERAIHDRPANCAPWELGADWLSVEDLKAKIRG